MRLQENTVAGISNLCKTSKEIGRITVCLLDHTGDLKKAFISCDHQHQSIGEVFPCVIPGTPKLYLKIKERDT